LWQPITQADLNPCSCQDWHVADAALNHIYAHVLTAVREIDR